MARPRKHDRGALVADICAKVAAGSLVKDACAQAGIDRATLHRWTEESEEFRNAYARAREDQAHAIAEEALAIADAEALTSEAVARNRLRVDTRKWMASKLAPRAYGEKVTLGTEDGKPIEHVHRVIRWGTQEIPL